MYIRRLPIRGGVDLDCMCAVDIICENILKYVYTLHSNHQYRA